MLYPIYTIVYHEIKLKKKYLDSHPTELQAVSISLMVWHQVIVVEYSDSEDSRVHAHTKKEDADKARHLVGRKQHNSLT